MDTQITKAAKGERRLTIRRRPMTSGSFSSAALKRSRF
jgi:hypothetical protein